MSKRRRAGAHERGRGPTRGRAPKRVTRLRLDPGAIAVLVVIGLFFAHAWFYSFTMDDAFISLRFAKNFVEGEGLVFNPGERVEGYSNFSWTMLLALFLKLGLPPIEVSRWLGVIFAAAAIFLAARIARVFEGKWGWLSLGVALVAAANTALAYWSTSGMETGFFVFLITAAFERGAAPGVSAAGRRLAPILFALAALTRPDAPLFFVIWIAVRAWATRTGEGPLVDPAGWRGVARDAAVFVAPLVPYALWKLWYYGDLLPNTYYAKAGFSAAYFTQGVEYAVEWTRAYGLWGVLPALSVAALADRENRWCWAAFLAPMTAYAVYVVVVGGDVLPFHRFWLAIFPLGCVLLAAGIWQVVSHGLQRRAGGAVGIAVTGRVTFTLLAVVAAVGFWRNYETIQARRQVDLQSLERVKLVAFHLKERLEPHEAIASTANGALPYFSERPFIDMLGLTDREIAKHPRYEKDLADTWKEKKYNAASVLRRRPAAIMFSTGIRPSSVAEKSLFLYGDFRQNYYSYEFRVKSETPWTNVLYRLRPEPGPSPEEWVPTEDRQFIKDFNDGLIAQGRDRDIGAAVAAFARAAESGPPDFLLAQEWAVAMRWDAGDTSVVPQLRQVVENDSLALRATTRLARYHVFHGEYDEAEALFRQALRCHPDLPGGWEGLAEIRSLQGRYPEALEFVRRSLTLWNTNPASLVLFARLCLRVDNLEGAEAGYQRALLLDPNLEEARRGVEKIQEELAARSGAR